jgi:hypothetical protein
MVFFSNGSGGLFSSPIIGVISIFSGTIIFVGGTKILTSEMGIGGAAVVVIGTIGVGPFCIIVNAWQEDENTKNATPVKTKEKMFFIY